MMQLNNGVALVPARRLVVHFCGGCASVFHAKGPIMVQLLATRDLCGDDGKHDSL